MDPLRRTREGATALQLAKTYHHEAVAAALQQLTEHAARLAEDSLLQASRKGPHSRMFSLICLALTPENWSFVLLS